MVFNNKGRDISGWSFQFWVCFMGYNPMVCNHFPQDCKWGRSPFVNKPRWGFKSKPSLVSPWFHRTTVTLWNSGARGLFRLAEREGAAGSWFGGMNIHWTSRNPIKIHISIFQPQITPRFFTLKSSKSQSIELRNSIKSPGLMVGCCRATWKLARWESQVRRKAGDQWVNQWKPL